MIQTDKLTHIKIEIEKLKTGMEALIGKTDALSTILDKIDDLLFRKNGGEKAIIHVLNKHQSFIIEHKSFRKKMFDYAIGFIIGLLSAGAVFWFAVVSKQLLK
jgi:hypothetical protein